RACRQAGEPVVKDAEVSVTDIRPMGYGVQLVFDDGHDRGIFPWQFLAALSTAQA
ncbi:gamma-butyrobetaine hydroxylase-like domain-containing protein, partial [Burkholderia sp. Ac-20379]|uniref:gamma-butyrobetaine hydroxylase-like domain-containing protein n=1 Tax=Burkholderia sp. Ac-20379 TaxID=2703900 RepID=UPI00197FFB50